MIKGIVYLIVAVSAIGIYLGVIEVKFHPDKLGNLSTITQGVGSWQDVVAKAEYYGTIGKRTAERYFASSADAKFTLDIAYVREDANSLAKALDAHDGVNSIVLKATSLSDTLNRTKSEMKDVSKDGIAKVRDDALKVFADAQIQLNRLKAVSNTYKQAQDQLEKLSIPSPIPLKF